MRRKSTGFGAFIHLQPRQNVGAVRGRGEAVAAPEKLTEFSALLCYP
jgi:hypothetical protein